MKLGTHARQPRPESDKHMHYLGIDVHSAASIWCLLDQTGEQLATGSTNTTFDALSGLATDLRARDELLAGQEVGTQAYLVHDAFSHVGVPIQSFNAAHLRMIAASRKKTDKRDAYWIARTLQTGMTPHPVFLPTGEVRELRRLLQRRRTIQRDRNRWQYRARAALRSVGLCAKPGVHYIRKLMNATLEEPTSLTADILESVGLAERFVELLDEELAHVDAKLSLFANGHEVINRLQTIPGIGIVCAATLYAVIGEIERFPNANRLAAYAGLVPSVRRSGATNFHGGITKEGSPQLRATLVQAAHTVTRRSTRNAEAVQAVYHRIRGTRGRRKIALVAVARHLLRIAFHVWRDGTIYDAKKLRPTTN